MATYKEYTEEKKAFLNSIGDWNCETSSMDEYGRYNKTYIGEKGTWYEVMTPVWETAEAEVEIHGIKTMAKAEMKMMRIEFWSSKNSKSQYYYEKW
jgi:hypothetical protein